MHSITRNHARAHAAHDHGARGFVLWITVYAAFMLTLIAFSGPTPLIDYHHLSWPVVGSIR